MKMKKLISFLLICVTVFFVAVFPTSADEVAAEPAIATEEFKLLKGLGMTYATMDTLTENKEMTRGEFAYVVAKLLGYNPGIGHNCAEFWDVGEEYYAEAIYYLRDLSVVSGVNGYMFYPQNTITYDEALSMAVNALGYTQLAVLKYGNYPNSVRFMGKELDLTKGIDANYTSSISAGNAFKLLKNVALTTEMTHTTYTTEGEMTEAKRDADNNLLYTRHDITSKKGRMTACGFTSVELGSTAGEDHVLIGGIKLSNVKFPAAKQYIGRMVDFYYNEDTEELIYCAPTKNADAVLEIAAEDLLTGSGSFTVNNIPYYDDSNRTEKAAVKIGAAAVLNGKYYPAYTANDLKIDTGRLVLIDTDKNDEYDIVIIEEYQDYVVSRATDETLDTDTKQFSLADMKEAKAYDANGNEIKFAGIAKNSVVSVYESSDGELISAYVTNKKISGTLESATDNGSGETVYTVGGADYEASPAFAERIKKHINNCVNPSVGENYTFWMNVYGKIVHAEKDEAVSNYTAYCVGIASVGSVGSRVQAKLVMTDGEVFTPYLANKVTVNDVSGIKSADLIAKNNAFFNAEGKPIRQPVKLKLNQDGDVINIETAQLATNSVKYDIDNFSLDRYYANIEYNKVYHALQDLCVSADAVLFSDPYLAKPADAKNVALTDRVSTSTQEYETEDVKVYVGSEIPSGEIGNIYVYEINHALETSLLVCNMDAAYSESQSPLIVDKVKYTTNEDGETVKLITGYTGRTAFSYAEDEPGIIPNDVKQGDIASYAEKNGKIMSYTKLVSLADGTDDPCFGKLFWKGGGQPTSNTTSALDDEWINFYGYLYAVTDSALAVKLPGWNSSGVSKGGILTDVVSAYRYAQWMIVYDKTNKTVTLGTPSDLYTPCIPDADGNIDTSIAPKVFVYKRWNYAHTVVMVKE